MFEEVVPSEVLELVLLMPLPQAANKKQGSANAAKCAGFIVSRLISDGGHRNNRCRLKSRPTVAMRRPPLESGPSRRPTAFESVQIGYALTPGAASRPANQGYFYARPVIVCAVSHSDPPSERV
jgi:hypothetical protein